MTDHGLSSVPLRAVGKSGYKNSVSEWSPVYSGMMSYEKTPRESPLLGFMFEMPNSVARIGVSRS